MKQYMAKNHNGTDLMNKPGTFEEATREAAEYMNATGNQAHVYDVNIPEVELEKAPTIDELYPWRQVLLWSVIASMKLGIINDINAKILPPNIVDFRDLHNYVDANEYGGFCIEEFVEPLIQLFGGRDEDEGMPQAMLDFMNEAQGVVDAWIKGANKVVQDSGPKLIIVN